ncbi:cation:proton antiporter [candidate division KSB1 bacterium]
MVLMLVVVSYTSSRIIQPESGLIAVTIMGIVLANQRYVALKHIIEFKEVLSVLLVSSLFIILSASLQMSDVRIFNFSSLLFILLLIFVIRPAAVLLSTIGSKLDWRERIFLFWMAPRGIVAAAISSIFAIRLEQAGYTQALLLMPLTFFVIIGTVVFYGLTASYAARFLNIAVPNPEGVLIIGAHNYARSIAKCLQEKEFRVMLVDTNRENIANARMEGLSAHYGNVLSENIFDEIDLGGIGRVLSLTSNDEVNNLAAMHFLGIFDSKELYHLASNMKKDSIREPTTPVLRGRVLFNENINHDYLHELFDSGAEIKCTQLTEKFNYDDFKKHYGNNAVPLFLIAENKKLIVFASDFEPVPEDNQILISVVKEQYT